MGVGGTEGEWGFVSPRGRGTGKLEGPKGSPPSAAPHSSGFLGCLDVPTLDWGLVSNQSGHQFSFAPTCCGDSQPSSPSWGHWSPADPEGPPASTQSPISAPSLLCPHPSLLLQQIHFGLKIKSRYRGGSWGSRERVGGAQQQLQQCFPTLGGDDQTHSVHQKLGLREVK